MIIDRLTSGQRGNGQKKRIWFLLVCAWGVLMGSMAGCGSKDQPVDEVIVFAATSVQTAMQEVADTFQAEYGITVRLNFAASGALAQQIIAGGGADVFVSASEKWIDEIATQGWASEKPLRPMLSNSMVVVANASTDWELDSIEQLNDLPFRYLLVGDPSFVPAGKYAKRFLQSAIGPAPQLSLWDAVDERICPTSDLRRVLALVDSDVSLIGIVYATDIVGVPGVRVIHSIPASKTLVDYYAVPLNSTAGKRGHRENASKFRDYLFSESSSVVFKRHGFRVSTE